MDLYSHYSRQVQRIKDRAVARGLERRAAEEIAFVGVDEKSDLIGGVNGLKPVLPIERPHRGRERAKARSTGKL